MMEEFKDKVAIVTGGASGIGEAVVRELARGGATVLVADLNFAAADKLAAELGVHAYEVDVSDPSAVEHMVESVMARFGRLHLAVNNAGIGGANQPTADYPIDNWRNVIAVNLDGTFHCMKYEIPAMSASGGGSIVNMASILATHGWAGGAAYAASKHAIIGLTKTAALEYAAKGIRVNAVGPGFITTPSINERMDEAAKVGIAELHPIGRLGDPVEVAALTCFLLSDRASFITGSYHLVDGGFAAR